MGEYKIKDTTLAGIASAIRSKTGSTAAIQVSRMAAAISEIVVTSTDVKVSSGSFTFNYTTGIHIVEHNLGAVPDMVVVFPSQAITASGAYLAAAVGFSKASMKNKMYLLNGSEFAKEETIVTSDTQMNQLGMIREANASTFKVGGTSASFVPDVTYRWYAVSGLF